MTNREKMNSIAMYGGDKPDSCEVRRGWIMYGYVPTEED